MPDISLLGSLNASSDIEGLFKFIKNLPEIDYFIIALDTVAYGGLVTSRRTTDSFDSIRERIEKLKSLIPKNTKVLAFSSIMRISNNNINEEEKEYWNLYGKKIFEYSYNFHKNGSTKTDIPKDILNDYLSTRKRNFEINKLYLEWQKENFFETLIFSKDDCAEYGLNVMEAEELQNLISSSEFIKTGADEIPLSLLSRAITDTMIQKIKVCPIFLEPEYKNLISNYEDISIEKSVNSQLKLAGCEITDKNNADILLFVNNFKKQQGEIVMKIPTEPFQNDWSVPEKPYIIADVKYANGADNKFVEKVLDCGFDEKFFGYSAWNTSANTLGSLICAMICYYQSLQNKTLQYNEFKKLQIIRFLDDWAYQANVRQKLKTPDSKKCKELMKPFENSILKIFDMRYNIEYKFPWNRLFEVEIELS